MKMYELPQLVPKQVSINLNEAKHFPTYTFPLTFKMSGGIDILEFKTVHGISNVYFFLHVFRMACSKYELLKMGYNSVYLILLITGYAVH